MLSDAKATSRKIGYILIEYATYSILLEGNFHTIPTQSLLPLFGRVN